MNGKLFLCHFPFDSNDKMKIWYYDVKEGVNVLHPNLFLTNSGMNIIWKTIFLDQRII